MKRWRWLQYVLVIALVAFALRVLLGSARDISELSPFRRVLNYWWLAMALGLQMLQYLSDGYFTRRLLKLMRFDVSLKDTVRIAALDIFGATLLPLGQLGSMAAALYFYRQRGLPPQAIVFLNVSVAAVTTAVLTVLFAVALLAVPAGTFLIAVPARLWIAAAAISVTLAAFVTLASLHAGHKPPFVPDPWYRRVRSGVDDCFELLGSLSGKRREFAGSIAGKDVAYYSIDIASIECCFFALHVAPHLGLVATAYVVSLVFGYIAMTPAGLGATDAVLTLILAAGGVAPGPVLGMLILYRLINVVLPAPFGAWCFYTLGRERPMHAA